MSGNASMNGRIQAMAPSGPRNSTPGARKSQSGGSAFGLASADGVMRWLAMRGTGYATPAGPVPLVAAAVVYDLALGAPRGEPPPHPDAAAGEAACEAASRRVERGSVGVGTGCT